MSRFITVTHQLELRLKRAIKDMLGQALLVLRPDIARRIDSGNVEARQSLQAAMGRVFFVIITGGGPGLRPGIGTPPPLAIALIPSLLLEILIIAGFLYDWRTRGRPHPVWLIGAAIMTAVILLRGPLSGTSAWLTIADAMAHFAG